jgi:hypothetical protein
MIKKFIAAACAVLLLLGCAEVDEAGGETPLDEDIQVELQAFASYEETMDALVQYRWGSIFADGYNIQMIQACMPGGSDERYRFCRTTTWSHTVSFQIYNQVTKFCEIKTTHVPRKTEFTEEEMNRYFNSGAAVIRLILDGDACKPTVPTLQEWVEKYEKP